MTTKTIDRVMLQDAFHYALAACGGEAFGYESAFAGRDREMTRTAYMKRAARVARESGLDVRTPRTLAGAKDLARSILDLSHRAGVDANGGCWSHENLGLDCGTFASACLCPGCTTAKSALCVEHVP